MRAHSVGWKALLGAASLLVTTACSGEGLAGAFDDSANDGAEATAGLTGDPSGGQAPSDGAADSTGEPGPAATGDDDSTGGSVPESEDACEGVACGPGGSCVVDEAGAPACSCEDGYAAYGMRCLSCMVTTGDVSINVPLVQVEATFTLNDGAFTSSVYEYGAIVLRDRATGDIVELGLTNEGGTKTPVAMVPGTYEVQYMLRSGGEEVPANEGKVLQIVEIPDAGTYSFAVDVQGVPVYGAFTMGGQTPSTSVYENGTVVLRNPVSGDEVELGDTRDGSYEAMIAPGTYDVHYRRRLAESEAPLNGDIRLYTVEVFDGTSQLDLDVPVTMLSGTFTVDGQTPSTSVYENGRILLRSTETGDTVELGQTRDGTYQAPIVPGEYQIVYARMAGGVEVPVNAWAVLDTEFIAGSAQTLDIDIRTAILTGAMTINGAAPPTNPADDGLLVLRNLGTGDEAILGNTHDGTFARRVVQGNYDVYYRQESSGGGVPANTNALISVGLDVIADAAVSLDVPQVTASASVTLNGQTPPDTAYDDGLLYLRNTQTDDSVLLGNTREASLQRPVVPGVYDLVYVVEAAGPMMPVNAQANLETVDLSLDPSISVDIPSADLHAFITVADAAPPGGVYDRGVLLLHDVETGDEVFFGPIDSGELRKQLAAGTYVVAYRAVSSNGLVPENHDVGVACYQLQAP